MPTPAPVLRTFAAEGTSLLKGISRTAFIAALLLSNHTAKRACVLPGAARAVGERGARIGARGRVARERGCCRHGGSRRPRQPCAAARPCPATGGPRGGERATPSLPTPVRVSAAGADHQQA